MADTREACDGVAAAAEALLRGTGGRAVWLRLPAAAAAGDDAEQMGLAVPQFQDVELAPCVFRKAGSRKELLVSAAAVKAVVGSLQFDSAAVLFATAVGVVVEGVTLGIDAMVPVESMGVAACYRLTLRV